MGVKDLFKLTNMEALDNKYLDLLQNGIRVIGVDMYVLLHKFAIDVDIAATLVNNPDIYLKEYYQRIRIFLESLMKMGFELYLVYDGNKMKYKITEEERQKRRDQAKLSNSYIEAVEIVPQQMYNFQHYLSSMRLDREIKYIVAPFEADAQLAYLYKQKLIDCVLTNDSDLIIYGVEHIMFLRPKEDSYYEYQPSDEIRYVNNMEKIHLPMIAFLIGCDYFKGIKGVGWKRAFELVKETIKKTKDLPRENELIFKALYNEMKSKKYIKELESKDILLKKYLMVYKVYTTQYVIDPRDSKLKDLQNRVILEEYRDEFGMIKEIEKIMNGSVNPISNQVFQLRVES